MLTDYREETDPQESQANQGTLFPVPKEHKESRVIKVTKENKVHLGLLVMMWLESLVPLGGREHPEIRENQERRVTLGMPEKKVSKLDVMELKVL